jgi:hypothetical protein
MPGTKAFETYKDKIFTKRKHYGEWDMAHIIIPPEKMSIARFYYNIVKTYYNTSAGLRAHFIILKKYGLFVYLRVLFGSLYITFQYVHLILKNIGKKQEGYSHETITGKT